MHAGQIGLRDFFGCFNLLTPNIWHAFTPLPALAGEPCQPHAIPYSVSDHVRYSMFRVMGRLVFRVPCLADPVFRVPCSAESGVPCSMIWPTEHRPAPKAYGGGDKCYRLIEPHKRKSPRLAGDAPVAGMHSDGGSHGEGHSSKQRVYDRGPCHDIGGIANE